LKVLGIDRVLRGQEALLKRGIRASMIMPRLLNSCEPISARCIALRKLKELGIEEVAISPDGRRADHPYPPEVLAVMRIASRYLNQRGHRWFPAVQRDDRGRKAYVYLFNQYHAVVPYVEWPSLLPDPDIRGLKAYSTDLFIRYLDACERYCREVYGWMYGEDVLKWAVEDLESVKDKVRRSRIIIPLEDFRRKWGHGFWVILDEELRSRGVKFVSLLMFQTMVDWVGRAGNKRFYCVISEAEAERLKRELSGKWREGKGVKALWRKVAERGRICDNLVRVSLSDLKALLEFEQVSTEESERILGAIRDLCDPDEIYLYRREDRYPTYLGAGASIHYPLKVLYLVRSLRDRGFRGARIYRRCARILGVSRQPPSLLVCLGEVIHICDFGGWRILVKPRKDLKVEYPCEARLEEGSIVIVDREALEDALSHP